MSNFRFELSEQVRDALDFLEQELSSFIKDAANDIDERPDSWRESEEGFDVSEWMDRLTDLLDSIEDTPDRPLQ